MRKNEKQMARMVGSKAMREALATASRDEADPRGSGRVQGADYSYSCGCYWFCGNVIACATHRPVG